MTYGYCHKCGHNVLLIRERIKIGLAIMLLICGGIGLIIYLWIHYSKEKNICIHCKTIISLNHKEHYQEELNPYIKNSNKSLNHTGESIIRVSGEKFIYCSLCGKQIIDKNIEYCTDCGSKI